MLPEHVARRLSRAANADAVAVDASQTFALLYAKTADTLAEAGVDGVEAEALARDLIKGILSSLAGAGDAMVAAMAATAEAARTAPRH